MSLEPSGYNGIELSRAVKRSIVEVACLSKSAWTAKMARVLPLDDSRVLDEVTR
jgi:hypothetical protein